MSCNPILEWLHWFQWEHYHWHHSIDDAQSRQAHTVNFTFSFAQKLYSYHTKQGNLKKMNTTSSHHTWHHMQLGNLD